MQCVTTYGKNKQDCKEAAVSGNFVKKALGWPDKLCHAKPKLKDKHEEKIISNKYEELLQSGNKAQLEKLKENEHKQGYDNIDIHYAYEQLEEKQEKLGLHLFDFTKYSENMRRWDIDYEHIRHVTSNIANFAHMIIFKCDKILKGKKG